MARLLNCTYIKPLKYWSLVADKLILYFYDEYVNSVYCGFMGNKISHSLIICLKKLVY